MAYASFGDVQKEFKNTVFNSTSFITDTTVTGFTVEMSALIDSYVGQRYAIPVTADATSLALLKFYCITLCADRIKKILEVKQATNTEANQDVRGAFSAKDVLKALEAIRKGDQLLPGATLLASPGGFYSYTADNAIQPKFHKDSEDW